MSVRSAFGLLLPDEFEVVSWQADRHEVETTLVQSHSGWSDSRGRLVVGVDLYEVNDASGIDVWFTHDADHPTRATVETAQMEQTRARLIASVALLQAIAHLLWVPGITKSDDTARIGGSVSARHWRQPPSESAVESFTALASQDFEPRPLGLELEPLASATRGPDADPYSLRLAPTSQPEGLLRLEVVLAPGPGDTTLVQVSATPTRQLAGRVTTAPSMVRVTGPNWAAVAALESDGRGRLSANLQGPGLLTQLNVSIALLHPASGQSGSA